MWRQPAHLVHAEERFLRVHDVVPTVVKVLDRDRRAGGFNFRQSRRKAGVRVLSLNVDGAGEMLFAADHHLVAVVAVLVVVRHLKEGKECV